MAFVKLHGDIINTDTLAKFCLYDMDEYRIIYRDGTSDVWLATSTEIKLLEELLEVRNITKEALEIDKERKKGIIRTPKRRL